MLLLNFTSPRSGVHQLPHLRLAHLKNIYSEYTEVQIKKRPAILVLRKGDKGIDTKKGTYGKYLLNLLS